MNGHCRLCGQAVSQWQEYGIPARKGRCPHCGSKARHREVDWLLSALLPLFPQARILEVGPSRCHIKAFVNPARLQERSYLAIDLVEQPQFRWIKPPYHFQFADMTRLPFADNSFDLVLCNQILQDVPDDQKAVSELFRVCNPQGLLMLNQSQTSGLSQTMTVAEYCQMHSISDPGAFMAENGHAWIFGPDIYQRYSTDLYQVQDFTIPAAIRNQRRDIWQLKEHFHFNLGFGSKPTRSKICQHLVKESAYFPPSGL